jgi:mannose-6-phosphate isomerase
MPQATLDNLPPILTFTPILVPKVWGGRGLEALGKQLPAGVNIGESWELADMPGDGPVSIVDQGPLQGQSVRQLLDTYGDDLMGTTAINAEGRFPLLIKFLDARENLSVQVHPDQAWVDAHPNDHLKSEAWLVLGAENDGLIHAGLNSGTSREQLAASVSDGSVVDLLRSVPAYIGDCHTLVSGTCHALGAGVLVAEVQTTSDTTFRVFDWGRTDRTIHVEQALACIDVDAAPPCVDASVAPTEGVDTCVIAHTQWFTMTRIASAGGAWTRPDIGKPSVLMCVQGQATVGDVSLPRGRTGLVPANAGLVDVDMVPGTVLVHAVC